jgi:ketosteroid isomerase-like protein
MRHRYLAAGMAFAVLAGCRASIGQGQSELNSANQISRLLAQWQKAFEAKDVNRVMAIYAPGNALTAYDIVPPLQYKGADAYRKDYADFFGQFDGPLHVEIRDSHIETGGNIGFAYGLERISGKLKSGQPVDMWVRYTSGFKRIDGQWRDVHDHVSVPADMDTGKAMLDLKP